MNKILWYIKIRTFMVFSHGLRNLKRSNPMNISLSKIIWFSLTESVSKSDSSWSLKMQFTLYLNYSVIAQDMTS